MRTSFSSIVFFLKRNVILLMALFLSTVIIIILKHQSNLLYLSIVINGSSESIKTIQIAGGDCFAPLGGKRISDIISSSDGISRISILLPEKSIQSLRFFITAPVEFRSIIVQGRYHAPLASYEPQDLAGVKNVELVLRDGFVIARPLNNETLGIVELPQRLPSQYEVSPLFFLALFSVVYFSLWSLFQIVVFLCSSSSLSNSSSHTPWYAFTRLFLNFFLVFGACLCLGIVLLEHAEQEIDQDPVSDRKQKIVLPYQHKLKKEQVRLIREPDKLGLSGQLYLPDSGQWHGEAVVLMHGNYPQGSQFPLYEILSNELARRGYLVFSFDFAGFGKSDDPFSTGSPLSVNLDIDARAALHFVAELPGVDSHRIHLVGHSMGADPVISVGSLAENVSTLTLIGPPRRVFDRFHYQPDLHFFWQWAHKVRKSVYGLKQFPAWYTRDVWQQQILSRDMVNFLPYFSGWHHKPVFFIEGGREDKPDRTFLHWYYCKSSWPKRFLTLAGADHQCNVQWGSGGRILYDPEVMEQLVNELDCWFKEEKSGVGFVDYLLNGLRKLFALEMLKRC